MYGSTSWGDFLLDFKSMYPSMIMKYNICFTTFDPSGEIVAPNGVHFLARERREGLVPRLLKELMDQRDAVKRQMKTASPGEKEYLDGVQGAIKILMNTFYGVLASSFYRFTNLDIGGAVTAFARKTITSLIEKLKSENYRVIYGDTDSIFIESGASSDSEAVKVGMELSERVSRDEGVTVEFEKVMDPLFSHGAKKRYAGKIIYPESQKGEILVIPAYAKPDAVPLHPVFQNRKVVAIYVVPGEQIRILAVHELNEVPEKVPFLP